VAERDPLHFRVGKLDVIVALLTAHLGFDVANPVLIPEAEPVGRLLAVVALTGVTVLVSALWKAR
jgi:hypothetical protein